MPLPTTPVIDGKRIQEMDALLWIGSVPEPEFNSLALLASEMCDVPVALISLIHQDQIWFKSRVGFDADQALRTQTLCRQMLEDVNPIIVEDASADPRFQNTECVLALAGIRFFASIPLVLASGVAVGCLCVIDHKPKTLTDKQFNNLKRLAGLVVALIDAKRNHFRMVEHEKNRLVSEQRLAFALEAAEIGDWDMDLRRNVARRSRLHDQCFGYTELVPVWGYDTFLQHILEVDRDRVDQCFQRAMAGEGAYDVEFRVIWADQTLHWLWSKGRFYFDDHGKPYRVAGIVSDITERKKIEEDFRESEYRWRFAIEGSGDGLWDWDIQKNHVFYSERSKAILGLGIDKVVNKPVEWAANLHPEDKERVLAELQSHLDGQTDHYTSEHRILGKGGSPKWVLGRGLVVQRDVNGKPLRVIGTNSDITERKQVESALQSTNAQLQLLETCVSRLNDIVLITEAEPIDENGPRIVFVNDAFVRRTGFSREEVIGQTPRILQGEKTQREELDRIRAALQCWEPVRAELINYTKAGQEFWLELEIVPVTDSTGRYTHWVSVERDITQRKSAEVALHESEMRHRSMFETNPQPMWVYDTKTLAFLSVNDAAIAQYGYTRAEFMRMSLRDIFPTQDNSNSHERSAIDLERHVANAQVQTHFRRDGSKIQVEVSSHAMDFQGQSARLVLALDITERMQSQAKVNQLAFYDFLTGLPNRVQFLDFASQVMRSSEPGSHLSACILLDLDNFKAINDHWGHQSGDELLKQVALRVHQCLPQSGFLARLGGDEFIVILKNIGADQATASLAAQAMCSKILLALARGFSIHNREQFTSGSLGVALFGDTEMTVDELLSRADIAMYSAKADGRNGFRFFDEQLQAQLAEQSKLEADLRLCIQNDELHLVFQPQFDRIGNIIGTEALLRWTHPLRGLVPPAQFIAVAENNGFIVQIGQWILHSACMALTEWQLSKETAGLAVAVNVSAKQFHHPDFVSQVMSVLEITGANPALLKLELTESLLAQDLDGIVQKMNTLKARGVTFSLDDFGTGYSSLAYLKRLPLQQLKIDQGFVRDVLEDSSDAAIVRTVIALGDRLGLNVIAEGVETQAQKEFLESNGCYSYQGYLFSRPLKKKDFEVFCATKRNETNAC